MKTWQDDLKLSLEVGLEALGSTEKEVFETLYAKGCYGVMGDPENCPVWTVLDAKALAEYVQIHLPEAQGAGVAVDGLTVDVYWYTYEGTDTIYHDVSVDCPAPVRQFITAFDDGVYPDLKLPEAE